MVEGFVDDFGGTYRCHAELTCSGPACPIHRPTEHHMRDLRILYRPDAAIFERVCRHGIGHPDPDSPGAECYRHGCDGCCDPESPTWLERLGLPGIGARARA